MHPITLRAKELPRKTSRSLFRRTMQKCYIIRAICYKGSLLMLVLMAIYAFHNSMFLSYPVRSVCPEASRPVRLEPEFEDSDSPTNVTMDEFAPPNRHLPHCIIIGAKKTGTRALTKFLSIHPEIVPVTREQHFFDGDINYKKGLEFYLKSMPYSFEGQLTIEKTAAYFTDARVPERIAHMNKSVKILFMVREPVVRLVSDYTQLREAAIKAKKSHSAFESEVFANEMEVDTSYKPVQTSMYNNYMYRWLKYFPWKQIHIVDGDQFEKDPYSEISKIETFLGVDHLIKRENFFLNETKGFFCINGGGPISPCLQNFKRAKYPYVEPKLLKKLYDFYRPHNKAFFKIVKRTFEWDNMEEYMKFQNNHPLNQTTKHGPNKTR